MQVDIYVNGTLTTKEDFAKIVVNCKEVNQIIANVNKEIQLSQQSEHFTSCEKIPS